MPTWVDFKELRKRLTFERVLGRYQVEIKRKRNGQHQGPCPLPNHGGNKRSPSFSANLERGIFQCFDCKAHGNLLEFAALMEGVDPDDGAALRRVALRLEDELCSKPAGKAESAGPQLREDTDAAPVVVNTPLDFELKGLDFTHPYLPGRGFTAETIAHFGLGVAARGLLKDRLAIPLHRQDGKLVGYAGRVVDDAAITKDNPRYLFPTERNRDGVTHVFRRSEFLYDGFRVETPVDNLVVVKGFTGVWWLDQHGYFPAVATMGADCSEAQARQIVALAKPGGRIWLMPDGDAAGVRHAHSLLAQVAPYRLMRWVKLPEGKQPTDLSAEELADCFTL